MTNRVIDIYLKDCSTYMKNDWYWVINPSTNEWVVSVGKSGYTFFNKNFWDKFLMFCPSNDLTDDIRNWVTHKLNTPLSKHCYPDYVVGDYDWRDEFGKSEVIDVITNGVLI